MSNENNEPEYMIEDEHSIKDTENAQTALNAILGREEFKGLSENRKDDEFINALCGKKICEK